MSAITDYDWSTSTVQQRAAEAKESSSSSLGMDAFLQLLITQLTNQDPLSPMEDIDFTSQLAQLQALEEQIKMNESISALLQDNQLTSATNMIGNTVSGVDSSGESVSGTVSGVSMIDGDVYVTLDNGSQLLASNIYEVKAGGTSIGDEISSSSAAIGMWVEAGYDSAMQPVKGIVENVSVKNGVVYLDLYGGKSVTWDQVTLMRAPTESESWYTLPDDIREQAEAAYELIGYVVTGSDSEGNSVTGLVANAELDGSKVNLIFYDGTRVEVGTVVGEKSMPDADQAEKALSGLWVVGYDSTGTEVSGLVVGAEDVEDGLVLRLAGGGYVYYDMLSEIRDATDAERAASQTGGDADASGEEVA